MGSKLRQRIEVTCPMCGKPFNVELEVSTYVTAETAVSTVGKHNLSTILQGQQAKVDFVLRAMKALASNEPSGMVEVSDVIDIAEKVGLSKESVQEILNGEKNAGRIYEPKPGVVCFTLPQERAKS